MNEFSAPAGDRHTRRPASVPAGVRYPVLALVSDEDAAARALGATRRLIRLVSEFDAASFVAFDIRTTGEKGRLALALEVRGDAAEELTATDLAVALGEGLTLGDPSPVGVTTPPPARTAYEMVPTAVAPMFRAPGSDDASRPDWVASAELADGPVFALPVPHDGDSGEPLLAAMARTGERLWVRTILGPADELATRMVIDELNAAMHRHAVTEYARIPVTARTVVVSAGAVPVAVRAALRQRGTGLRLVPIEVDHAMTAWRDPVGALRSAAVGEAHAVALTRIPTAGTLRPLGVTARPPAVPERPLDPMPPAPADPIRLGWAFDAYGRPASVELDATDLLRHVFIEGRSGSGKTTTITHLFWSLTRAGHQVIYLDPHGDGASRAAAFSTALAGTASHVIRHGDRQHPIRMNPLAEGDAEARERALSEFLELIQNMLDPQREGMVGERFKRTFTLVAQAVFVLFGPRTSLTDVLALALTKTSLRSLADAVRPAAPDVATRVDAELVALGDKEFADLVSWFVSRLQPFLRTPALREILGTGEDSVDVGDILASGKNLIVDLASLELGEDVARVLGALWLLKLRNAMGRRTDRRPIVVLIDEAHLYTFGALPGMLAEARKFGIGIVVATQAADNLSPRLARAIEANCGSAISLRTGIATAGAAAERLGGWSPLHLTRLPDLTAAASLSRGGVPTPAFTLHIDHFDVVEGHGWDAARLEAAASVAAAASLDLLWAPYADREVLGDAQVIGTVVAVARRRARMSTSPEAHAQAPADARPRMPRPVPEPGTSPSPTQGVEEGHPLDGAAEPERTDGLLDRWLSSRGAGAPAEPR